MSSLTLAAVSLLLIPVMKHEYNRMIREQNNRKKRIRKYTQTEFI